MKSILCCFAILAVLMGGACSKSQEAKLPKKVGEIKSLTNPHSIVFDVKRNQFFVSQKPHKAGFAAGSIALVSETGKIIDKNFVSDLDQPRGLQIFDDRLFVADSNHLIEIDIPSKKVVKRHHAKGSYLLNDVVVDEIGAVYISDTLSNEILKLDIYGNLEVWLDDAHLTTPTGMLLHDGWLYVVGSGEITKLSVDGLASADPTGRLVRINLETKEVDKLNDQAIGNLDGIAPDGRGNFFVSAAKAGVLYHVTSTGRLYTEYEIAKIDETVSGYGMSDIVFDAKKKRLYAPLAEDGRVLVLKPPR